MKLANRKIAGRVVRYACAFAVCMAAACESTSATAPHVATTNIQIQFITPATVRKIVVDVTGPGIEPALVFNIPVAVDSIARGSIQVPTGSRRRFVVSAFDSAGILTHRADTTTNVVSGATNALSLQVEPLTVSLPVTVTFGGSRITVQDTSSRTIYLGDSLRISASAMRSNGSIVPNDSLVWASSNPAIATVTQAVVRAKAPGQATIVVSYAGAAVHIRVTVPPASMQSVQSADIVREIAVRRHTAQPE